MKTQICFVGLDNYPVLNPAFANSYIGGESVQQTLLAKAMVSLGIPTSMVVADYGQPAEEMLSGISVLRSFRPGSGLPVIRFIHPRLTSIWHALLRADAEIYYQSCAGALTGFVAAFCQVFGRRFIYRVAHDTDCKPGEELIRYKRDAMLFRYGLRRADVIAVQTDIQAELIRKNYGRETVQIDMAVEIPAVDSDKSRDIDVLWVNNIRPFKRPDLVLEIARQLSDLRFVMIGGPVSEHASLHEEIKTRAAAVANLEFLGFVPYQQVNEYYARAKVFLNTSDTEGFPNSFLQAWIRGTPVVSYFDPDQSIRRHRLGESPSSLPEMIQALRRYVDDSDLRTACGKRAQAYVTERYSSESIARKYLDTIARLS